MIPKWMKDILTKRAKAPVLREIDRAIEKARSGKTGAEVVPALQEALVKALRGWLPAGIGEFLLTLILAEVNWDEVLKMTSGQLAEFLINLRKNVETKRF